MFRDVRLLPGLLTGNPEAVILAPGVLQLARDDIDVPRTVGDPDGHVLFPRGETRTREMTSKTVVDLLQSIARVGLERDKQVDVGPGTP